ncbi:unnamed protein product, partial [Candidula unifasciata]
MIVDIHISTNKNKQAVNNNKNRFCKTLLLDLCPNRQIKPAHNLSIMKADISTSLPS